MPTFDAILFDFDGVLVDSEPLHCAAWGEVLAPLGVRLYWEYYRKHYLGMQDADMIRQIAARANPPLDWRDLWARHGAKKEVLRRKLEGAPFAPGLARLLADLQRSYRLAVVSSSARMEVEPPLEMAGLRCYFAAVVTGQDVERPKPSPDPYLLAARLVSSRAPLVVEDSPAGTASGRAAGFEVLAVASAAEMPHLLRACLSRGFAPG